MHGPLVVACLYYYYFYFESSCPNPLRRVGLLTNNICYMIKNKIQELLSFYYCYTFIWDFENKKSSRQKVWSWWKKKGMEQQFVPRSIMGQGKWMCSCYLAHEICLSADRILILKQKAAELKPLLDQGKSPHWQEQQERCYQLCLGMVQLTDPTLSI